MLAGFRLIALFVLLLIGLLLALLIQVSQTSVSGPKIAAWWSRQLLRIFNVRVRIHGQRLHGPRVDVSNHISWLDMFVLATNGHCRYVAKSEVGQWPLVRTLANAMNTIYIRRGRGGAAPVVHALTQQLRNGLPIMFFPEGTTSDGRQILPFHARLFEAAVATQAPIQAIALSYRSRTDRGPGPAPFIGTDTLFAHIWRLLRHRGLRVEVYYCDAFVASSADEAAAISRAKVANKLGLELPFKETLQALRESTEVRQCEQLRAVNARALLEDVFGSDLDQDSGLSKLGFRGP